MFFGYFDRVQAGAFLFLLALLAILRRLHFFVFGRFGYVQSAAFLLFLAVLAMFRRLHFSFFRPFPPCSGGCIFIISSRIWLCCDRCHFIFVGRFGHVQAAAFLLLLAILAMFRRLDL